MPTEEARQRAREAGLDLVEVAPNARPPVCRIMDFGSFLYDLKRKEKAQRKNSKAVEVKGVRFGVRISEHDFAVKERAARKFLEKGNPVRAQLMFRGREMSHDELGHEKMEEFAQRLEDIAKVEQAPKLQGRQITMLLAPKSKK